MCTSSLPPPHTPHVVAGEPCNAINVGPAHLRYIPASRARKPAPPPAHWASAPGLCDGHELGATTRCWSAPSSMLHASGQRRRQKEIPTKPLRSHKALSDRKATAAEVRHRQSGTMYCCGHAGVHRCAPDDQQRAVPKKVKTPARRQTKILLIRALMKG